MWGFDVIGTGHVTLSIVTTALFYCDFKVSGIKLIDCLLLRLSIMFAWEAVVFFLLGITPCPMSLAYYTNELMLFDFPDI